MRIALLGDIHANLPALEAVLDDAQVRDVEAIWNVGDLVGYGPFPNEVIQRMQAVNALSIIGGYDRRVLKFPRKEAKWRRKKDPVRFQAYEWTYHALTPENRRYLRHLSRELRFTIAGQRVLITHGSPISTKEQLTPKTPLSRLRALAEVANADIVCCGMSHLAFTRRAHHTYFINPGSIGHPEDDDPRAAYAILTLTAGAIQTEHYRVAYDVERTVAALRRYKLPDALARQLREGRDLDRILASQS